MLEIHVVPDGKQIAVSVWHTLVAVCTDLNSWWWTEMSSKTCTVLFQNKFQKLVHLVGFTIEICYDVRPYDRHTRMFCI
jgi:hypothetical protein